MYRRTLVADLIVLTGRSASSLANEIGVFRGSVTHWLKHGGTSIGIEKQNKLLDKLGVVGSTLSSDRVHGWILPSGDLSPLVRILSWVGPGPFMIVYVDPGKQKRYCAWESALAIYDLKRKIRILVRRKLNPIYDDKETIDSLVASGLANWKDDPFPGIFPPDDPVQIDSKIFDAWMEGCIPVEEYDRILGLGEGGTPEGKGIRAATMTWEAFNNQIRDKRSSIHDQFLSAGRA